MGELGMVVTAAGVFIFICGDPRVPWWGGLLAVIVGMVFMAIEQFREQRKP
jgi:hypothetical protein